MTRIDPLQGGSIRVCYGVGRARRGASSKIPIRIYNFPYLIFAARSTALEKVIGWPPWMATWKGKGYVPDSEEEDESQSSEAVKEKAQDEAGAVDGHGDASEGDESNVSRQLETSQHIETSPTQRKANNTLPVQIHQGGNRLQAASQVSASHIDSLQKPAVQAGGTRSSQDEEAQGTKNGSQDQEELQIVSRLSSPLSEAPSSLPELPELLALGAEHGEITIQANEPSDIEFRLGTFDKQLLPHANGITQREESIPQSRHFRARKPIQMHPYMLEGAKYNDLQRAHGLKPVHILQEKIAKVTGGSSRDAELSSEDEGYTASQSPSLVGSLSEGRDLGTTALSKEDDLPDLDDLLAAPVPSDHLKSRKRRKVDEHAVTPDQYISRKEAGKFFDPTHLVEQDLADIWNIPLSPPRSLNVTPSSEKHIPANKGFRIPANIFTETLPTPFTSSEPRQPSNLQISPLVIPGDETSSDAGSETDPEASPLLPPPEVDSQIEQAQRKIRGVLPASWLKLDLKAQLKDVHKQRPDRVNSSPTKPAFARGIARTVFGSAPKSGDRRRLDREILTISDDDKSDSSGDEPGGFHARPSSDLHLDDLHPQPHNERPERMGEAIEEDAIDAMLPPRKRRRYDRRQRSKIQRSLKDFGIQSKNRHLTKRPARLSDETRQSQSKLPLKMVQRRQRAKAPTLGILDSVEQNDPTASNPDFIRVASRTARGRNNKGRSSPNKKFLRLASRRDDQDVSNSLNMWKNGLIAPKLQGVTNRSHPRRPLANRSLNLPPVPRASDLSDHSDSMRDPENLGKDQYGSNFVRSKETVTSVDHFTESDDHENLGANYTANIGVSAANVANSSRTRLKKISTTLQEGISNRAALLESSETSQRQILRKGFQNVLSSPSTHGSQAERPGSLWQKLQMLAVEREKSTAKKSSDDSGGSIDPRPGEAHNERQRPSKTKSLRKRHPRQIPILQSSMTRSTASTPDVCEEDDHACVATRNHRRIAGLESLSPQISSTLGVQTLRTGVFFDQRTLTGSGHLQQYLRHSRELDSSPSSGSATINFGKRSFRWGPWDENVSSELTQCFEQRLGLEVSDGDTIQSGELRSRQDVIALQESVLVYLSKHVYFLDPIDRVLFLETWQKLLQNTLKGLRNPVTGGNSTSRIVCASGTLLREKVLDLLIANRICHVSSHGLVSATIKDQIRSSLSCFAVGVCLEISRGARSIEETLARLQDKAGGAYSVTTDDEIVEAFVVLHHVISDASLDLQSFWKHLCLDTSPALDGNIVHVEECERIWRKMFNLLPFLEIDVKGVLQSGRRFAICADGWLIVRQVLNPILKIYLANPKGQPQGYNSYCRTIFARCLHLINYWGWYRCESIIGLIFDFFAQNGLNNLRNEESHGSPMFLQDLSAVETLEVSQEDRSFHLLLKIVGNGLRNMRKVHNEKKIRDLAWRLMPNHGRYHPKDQSVRQEDLDALRNHHDLLSTLYWASPAGSRPSLSAIRNLVNFQDSHREACRIAISAWKNLAKFQVGATESTENLGAFQEWHVDFLSHMTRQHSLARVEAEDQIIQRSDVAVAAVSRDHLESTIASNQRHVEDILNDALVALDLAISSSRNQEAAMAILSPDVGKVFELFASSRTQVNATIIKALDLIATLQTKFYNRAQRHHPEVEDGDSQEYGDWSVFNAEASVPEQIVIPSAESRTVLSALGASLRGLLSNCFGSDTAPSDMFLCKVIDTWVSHATCVIRDGLKSWDDYINQFGKDSWTSLRFTHQTRKFSPYFWASVINADARVVTEFRFQVLSSWLISILERESLLKFQHHLTNAMLNLDHCEPLLQNLPFSRAPSGRFEISFTEFSSRRHSLISSVLSNMRVALIDDEFKVKQHKTGLRQEYKNILRNMMHALKQNYEELGQISDLRGSYVVFAQGVVQSLQEHSSRIHPIDRFFTDDASFPLPTADPSYAIGQLKNYALRLRDSGTPKQLAVFVQSLLERASLEGQQTNLTEQILSAFSSSRKEQEPVLRLRAIFMKSFTPAYIKNALGHPCGWIFAVPLMLALGEVSQYLMPELDAFNPRSVASTCSQVQDFLECMATVTSMPNSSPQSGLNAGSYRISAICFQSVIAWLPLVDYLLRLPNIIPPDVRALRRLATFASDTLRTSTLAAHEVAQSSDLSEAGKSAGYEQDEVYRFTFSHAQDILSKSWKQSGDRYFFVKGSTTLPVPMQIKNLEDMKGDLERVLLRFLDRLRKVASFQLGLNTEQWAESRRRTGAFTVQLII